MRHRHLYRLIVPLACMLAAGTAASAAQVIKLGYVDMDRAFKNYFETEKASANLAKEYDRKQADIDVQKDKIKKLQEELQTKRAILSSERKIELEDEIRSELAQLRSSANQADIELRKLTNDQTRTIVEEIRKIVQQIGTSEGYTVIFDKAAVLYAAPAFDLTEKVLDELNKSRPAAPSVPTDAE